MVNESWKEFDLTTGKKFEQPRARIEQSATLTSISAI
jgi:hypothetical protein